MSVKLFYLINKVICVGFIYSGYRILGYNKKEWNTHYNEYIANSMKANLREMNFDTSENNSNGRFIGLIRCIC